jgi:hypothetical protein
MAGRLLIAAWLLGLLANVAQAFTLAPPSGTNYPSYTPLDSWSFNDTTNWTSDRGYPHINYPTQNGGSGTIPIQPRTVF